jgi:hypothetical protein
MTQRPSPTRLLNTFGVIFVVCLAVAGCATPGSYSRIPARYTGLSLSPNSESYLIEMVHAASDPTATRYDFTIDGSSVTAQVSTISKSGARSERRRSEEIARRLLQVFRGFDWSSIEAPPPDDDGKVPVPDNTEVVFKARTLKSYREVQVRLSDCAGIRKLLNAIESVK